AAGAAAAALPFGLAHQARADITGFGDGSWSFNGSASQVNPTDLLVTDAVNGEAGSAFSTNAQNITNFTAGFTYNWISGSFNTADGAAFVLQNSDPDPNTAAGFVGGAGGGLGYSGMSNSAAL